MSQTRITWQHARRLKTSIQIFGKRNYFHVYPLRHDPQLPLNKMFNNDPAKGPLKLPGYGYPVEKPYSGPETLENSWSSKNPTTEGFCHGYYSWIQSRRNLVREIHMIGVMDALTDKKDWYIKVFDEAILAKWKVEAMNLPGRLISEMAWTWIVKELKWKADAYSRTGYTTTLETCSTLVKSDTLIGEDIKKELKKAVKPLMASNETEKDWHPGSDQKVLNLVHPSLYPLVYGRTRILPDRALSVDDCLLSEPGEGTVTDVPQQPVFDEYEQSIAHMNDQSLPSPDQFSTKFQWLPCDVHFTGLSGDEVQIVSYINNLHPTKHRDLYRIIEKVISKSIQPWNEVLRWYDYDETLLRIRHVLEIKMIPDPNTQEYTFGDMISDLDMLQDEDAEGQERLLGVLKEFLAQPDNPDHVPIPSIWENLREPFDGSFEGQWWRNRGLQDELQKKYERIRVIEHPEPGADKSFEDWKGAREHRLRPKIEERFREQGLQVIVKLSSIELTPDKPEYGGGNWHLEGKLNEHIVATSIYYYDVDNISESRIRFRQDSDLDFMEVEYSADDHGPIEDAYGVRDLHNGDAIQETGSIVTRQDRLLVFPNIVQHRVEPFGLKDRSKPGHRRFLVIWLVDPHHRVISTRNVAPQQHEWWKEKQTSTGRVQASGTEGEVTEGTMQQAEAEKYRLDLMEERTKVMDGARWSATSYNFCEH